MKKRLYTPLHLCQALHKQSENNHPLTNHFPVKSDISPFTESVGRLLVNENDMPTHLDDFINYSTSSGFMKQAYNGPYQPFNQHLIQFFHDFKTRMPNVSYQKCRTEFRDILTIRSVLSYWEQYKQAYLFDEDFVNELMQSTDVDIPVKALKRLPYNCYYLDFHHINRWKPFIGAFVYVGFENIGFEDPNGLMPNITILRITEPMEPEQEEMIFSAYFDHSDMLQNHMLTLSDPKEDHNDSPIRTLNPMIHFDETYQFDSKRTALNLQKRKVQLSTFEEQDLHGFLQFIFQTMLYLASNEPDIQPSTKQKYMYTGTSSSHKEDNPLKLYDVGVRYGNMIRIHQKSNPTSSPSDAIIKDLSNKPKRHITSHMRKAHWHTYWTGKGRTIPVVKWIPPTFICGDSSTLPVTIHKVKQ